VVEKLITFDDKGFWSEVFFVLLSDDTRYLVEYHCQKNQCYTQKDKIHRVLPNYNIEVENLSCVGSDNGKIKLNSLANLSLVWEDGEIKNQKDKFTSGLYNVEVRSQNGCNIVEKINIKQPTEISPIIQQYHISSANYAKIAIEGGENPYDIQWIGDVTQI